MEPQFPVLCSSKPLKARLEKFQRIANITDVVLRSYSRNTDKTDVKSTENEKLKEQVMLDQEKKEKQICDYYAVRIEKLKGPKTAVKRQKALLKMQRDIQLKEIRAEIEDKISSLTAKQNNNKPPEENNHSEEKTKEGELTSDSEFADSARPKNAGEKDTKRQRERKALRKLRRETRQLKLDKERKLKQMEKQKLDMEELKEELNKVNKKLAKEKKRVKQLLSQKEVSPSASTSTLNMESELMCSICSELFVHATTLSCSHSYCRYCIRKWFVNKIAECPICRATITSECSSIVLDSLIDKMTESSEGGKKKRQQLVKARDKLEAKEVPRAVGKTHVFIYTHINSRDSDY